MSKKSSHPVVKTRKIKWLGVIPVIVAFLACIPAYLALPQIQTFIQICCSPPIQATPTLTTIVMATLTPAPSIDITKPKSGAFVGMTERIEGKSSFVAQHHYLFVKQGANQFCQEQLTLSSDGSWAGNAMFGQLDMPAETEYTILVIATQSAISGCPGQRIIPNGISSKPVTVVRKKTVPDN